ncbi:MAG: YbhN family protein [Faecalibacterium sp.]
MMDQIPNTPRQSRRQTVLSLLVLLVLTGIMVFIFRENWAEIRTALSLLRLPQILLILLIGLTFPLFEAAGCWVIIRGRVPEFRYWQALDTTWINTFCNVVTFGAGTLPTQAYYLYRCGIPVGQGIGSVTLEYAMHKVTVLLYATILLLTQREWLSANATGLLRYLPMAYAMVAVIVLALVLVCVSPLVQDLLRKLMQYLPQTPKWQKRRDDWSEQLDVLSAESRHLLSQKSRCAKVFALHTIKLFLLYCVPYLAIRFMHLSSLTFWQVQLLSALTFFISNSLPNVAGMGSAEAAFLLVFGSFMGQAEVMSALMVYRLANYYFPVAVSAVGFWFMKKHMDQMPPQTAQS